MEQVSLKRPSKCEELQKLLRERITSGKIPPQSLFPSQNELAAAYQVSHITVREAVGVLVHEGLLTRIQGKGTFVTEHLPVKKTSLGLVLSPSTDISYPATAYVIRSITEECNKNNVDIRLFIYPDAGINNEQGMLKNLIESGDISGLLLHSLPSPADVEFLNKRSIPFLIISYDAPGKNIASISVDIAKSVDLVINHLASLGHRKIALLAGKDRHEILFKSFIGEYRNAIQKNSLEYDKDLVSVTGWGVESGKKEAERILRLPDPPTAVFCTEDLMALGFMRQSMTMGSMVPSDISVVGYSDRFPVEMYPVPLTTIDTFLERQSNEAVNHLLDIVKNNAKPQKLKVEPKLIVRNSTAELKKAAAGFFTLLEPLIVSAVIVIMMSLLLPTLTLFPWTSGTFEDITLRAEKPCVLAMLGNPPEIVSHPPPDDQKCITIEAENFKGNWNTQTNIPNYSGSGFRTSNAKGIAVSALSHSVNIPEPGKYTVWTRGYIGKPYKRGWHLEVNGIKMPGTHNDSSGNGFLWQRVGAIELGKGIAEIKILDDDTGFESPDTVLLTTDSTFDPMAREKYFRVLDNSPYYETMVFDRLKEYAAKCYKKFTPPANASAWDARAHVVQATIREKIGLDKLPPNAELNVKITGVNQFDGYRVENILLESIRGIYITANLYIPDNIAEKTLPAVVVACGHSIDTGKAYEMYQNICIGLAKQGIIAITFDPIGQGERKTGGNSHGENLLAILTGLTVNAIMIRDSQRIIDYLLTRKEVDSEHIGFTGTSGGGMNTLYTLPFDKRIKAGAVSSYFCGYYPFVATGWGHCVCSYIPGAASDFEEWEVLALNAPRPVLLHQGPTDYAFPVKGALHGYQNAKQIYSLKKAESDIGIFIASNKQVNGKITNLRWMGHGFHPPAREAVYGWFDKYLKNSGNGAPSPEPEIKIFDTCGNKAIPEQLRVLADGLPKDSVSFLDLLMKRWIHLNSAFPVFKTENDWNSFKGNTSTRLRTLLNVHDYVYTSEKRKTENISDNVCVERIVLISENGIPCPALFLKALGNTDKNPTVMIITDRKAQLVDNEAISGLIANGFNVFAFEPRAMGELAENNPCINISTGIGASISNGVLACDSILYGVPLMGQRVNDTLAALKYLRSRDDVNPEKLGLAAENLSCSWIAVYAAALDGHVQSLAVNALPTSFTHVLNHRSQLGWDTLVPGICEVLDLAHLAGMQAPRNLLWLNPVADQESQNQIKEIYNLSGAKKNLLFKTLKKEESPFAEITKHMTKVLQLDPQNER